MRDLSSIHNLCRICLNQGSRDIYDNNFLGRNLISSSSENELGRIAEKLRYVTLLKVNPKENLPQQICDLCIVQLNVSYNFKRLALKNDFYIRQYLIENGMSLTKDEDVDNGIETALEIHQIHNVIRTSNRRSLIAPAVPPHISVSEHRRNSTTSSVSGVSAMIVNGSDTNGTNTNGNGTNRESSGNNFAQPSRPFNVRPIQIKTEPIDPDYEDVTNGQSTVQSSPSNSSGSVSILTVSSSNNNSASNSSRPKTPPMIVINGNFSKSTEKTPSKIKKVTDTPRSPTLRARPAVRKVNDEESRTTANSNNENAKPRNRFRDLRIIKRASSPKETKKKLKEAALKVVNKKTTNVKVVKKVEINKKKVQDKRKIQVVHYKGKKQAKQPQARKGKSSKPVGDRAKKGVRGGGSKGRQRK